MATVTIRLDDRVKDRLEGLARGRGQTLSELIRDELGNLLTSSTRVGISSGPQIPSSLTTVERQQMALLHRILARVIGEDGETDGDREYQLQRARVLESGFVQQYSTVFAAIEPELSQRDCEFVMDVLDMFRRITFSIRKLRTDGVQVPEDLVGRLTFRGFDLADPWEGQLLDYARHLVDRDRWSELLPTFGPEHDGGHSHSRTADLYLRMLDDLKSVPVDDLSARGARDAYFLSLDDLARLADSRIHPGAKRAGPPS